MSAINKKNTYLSNYKTKKGKTLGIENGYELFVSDHFGVMTEFEFKNTQIAGKKRKTKSRQSNRRRKRRTAKRL